METLYAFRFQGDTLLVRSASVDRAKCRAFYEIVQEYDLSPDRLEELGWPGETDVREIDLSQGPALLEGG